MKGNTLHGSISNVKLKRPDIMIRIMHNFWFSIFRYEIMELCWQREPDKRPEFEELEGILGDLQATYKPLYEKAFFFFFFFF